MAYKLAILTSHPIQYQTPLFQKLAEQKDIDLTVLFCGDFGSEERYDVEFKKVIQWDIPLLDGYRFQFLRHPFEAVPKLIRGKYDAVVVYGWNSLADWVVFFTAFSIGLPVLLQGENPLNQELMKPYWKRIVKQVVLRALFWKIKACMYIGEENKNFYKYYGVADEKLFFTPYAVDNARFNEQAKREKEKREAKRKELRIDKSAVAILFVGKLIEKKRPFDLLKAYELVTKKLVTSNQGKAKRTKSPGTSYQLPVTPHLLFVGDGPLRPELEKYVKEHNLRNVIFIGFKNQTELPAYYAIADIFALPSGMGETWGLVVNEAMCFGLPVVVSDVVGCGPDLVRAEENGYRVPLENKAALTNVLQELADNRKRREAFGKRSFEIIQNYSYEKDIEGMRGAVKKLRV